MNIGDAKITIKADDKASAAMGNVGKSTSTLKDKFNKLKLALIGATVALGAFIGKALKDWAAAGDEVAKMADRTGVEVEALSELKHMLDLSGASLSDFEKANKKLSKTILDASYGLETYVRSFEQLGLDVDDLMKLSPEEQFWAVATALAGLEEDFKRSAIAQEVFGRAGTQLLPMLKLGKDGIDELRKSTRDTAYIFDVEAAEGAERLTDSMTNLNAAFTRLKYEGIDELDLDVYLDQLTDVLKDTSVWLEENDDLVVSFQEFVDVLVTAVEWLGKLYNWYAKLRDLIPEWLRPAELAKIMSGYNILASYNKEFGLNVPIPEVGPGERWLSDSSVANALQGGGGGSNITIEVGTFVGNESAFQEFARTIESAIGQNSRRTSFGTVNDTYFGGTSGP